LVFKDFNSTIEKEYEAAIWICLIVTGINVIFVKCLKYATGKLVITDKLRATLELTPLSKEKINKKKKE